MSLVGQLRHQSVRVGSRTLEPSGDVLGREDGGGHGVSSTSEAAPAVNLSRLAPT